MWRLASWETDGLCSQEKGSEPCLDSEPALELSEEAASPALNPWPRAQCQGPHRPLCCEYPPPQPLPHPGATLPRSLTVEALACRLSCCFFLPRSFKVGSGEGASGEDPQISGYVLAVLTPPLLLALHFLDWIMAPEPGLEEIWTLSVSSASFHQRGSRNHPGATEGAPPRPRSVPGMLGCSGASRCMITQLGEKALSPLDRGRDTLRVLEPDLLPGLRKQPCHVCT